MMVFDLTKKTRYLWVLLTLAFARLTFSRWVDSSGNRFFVPVPSQNPFWMWRVTRTTLF